MGIPKILTESLPHSLELCRWSPGVLPHIVVPACEFSRALGFNVGLTCEFTSYSRECRLNHLSSPSPLSGYNLDVVTLFGSGGL
jgi:hypothetical protein